jgi:HEAT repeat protein
MADYDSLLKQLKSSTTWCEAAQALAEMGDWRALAALVQAYEQPIEASRLCLLDAMEALDPKIGALKLYQRNQGDDRRLAFHLMELFGGDELLPYLEQGLSETDASLRCQARRALAFQRQTPIWEETMIRLLASPDPKNRAQAIDSLSRRKSLPARQALEARLTEEPDITLRNLINKYINAQK